ncbi:MAG: nucleotidyltransferase domain-containing protein [Desulfobacterales bacterium]|nr:nucleotidyltransferase domain-containing protein [Desulfobacterales bacterium]
MIELNIKNQIMSKLFQGFKLKQIILYGSYADEKLHEDSDVDLIVVLDEEGYAKSYFEKINRRMEISNALIDLRKKIPIDLLVYTKDEWEYLVKTGSSFIKQITQTGVRWL